MMCPQRPPSSTYYSTVPGDMSGGMPGHTMSSSGNYSSTYDDPARSDDDCSEPQYGGSTYSGGGPYARAVDSVSQSGTAKRISE